MATYNSYPLTDTDINDELKDVKPRKLEDLAAMDNVAELLDEYELECIGKKVLFDWEVDKRSMDGWLRTAKDAMKLCLLEREPKHTPWLDASNIKYPLIATAVMQFSSRSVAEMSKSGKVAKYKVLGQDKTGAKARKGARVADYMNYQIQEKMPNWFGERDKLHNQLAVCGTSFTKTYYDPVSMTTKSELIPYDQIFINNGAKSLEDAPRISQLVYMTPSSLVEHQRYGLFLDSYKESDMQMDESDPEPIYHELLEQHTFLDLDKDGLPEPYVVVYHIAHKCVLRIVPRFQYLIDRTVFINEKTKKVKRIVPDRYYSDYHFIPSPDGSFLSVGFGTLLSDTNHTINTLLNQLINAGTLATMQGGFIGKDLRVKKDDLRLQPGTWVNVDSAPGATIKDAIVPLSYKEPSQVLLQLMQQLIQGANNLTSTSEVLTGTTDVTNASPNSVAMLMQQGLKVYSSIQRRIFRGFRKELEIILKLDSQYLNEQEYLTVIDPDQKDLTEMYDTYGRISDFVLESLDIVPIVDIEDSTELESMNKAQSIMQAGMQFVQVGATDPVMLAIEYYKSMGIENIEALVPAPQPEKPDPATMQIQQDAQFKAQELQLKQQELQIKAAESQAKIKETQANTLKIMTDANISKGKLGLEANKQQQAAVEHRAKTGLELEKLQAGKENDRAKQDIESRKVEAMARRSSNTGSTGSNT